MTHDPATTVGMLARSAASAEGWHLDKKVPIGIIIIYREIP